MTTTSLLLIASAANNRHYLLALRVGIHPWPGSSSIMSGKLMTQEEAMSALLAYVFSGAIGSLKGKGMGYALMKATPTTFSWSAALEDIDGPATPIITRYLVKIDRRSKEISPPE